MTSTTEELQGRLNADRPQLGTNLPIHERRRLSPRRGDLSESQRGHGRPIRQTTRSSAYSRPSGTRSPQGELPSIEEVAPIVEKAGLLRQSRH